MHVAALPLLHCFFMPPPNSTHSPSNLAFPLPTCALLDLFMPKCLLVYLIYLIQSSMLSSLPSPSIHSRTTVTLLQFCSFLLFPLYLSLCNLCCSFFLLLPLPCLLLPFSPSSPTTPVRPSVRPISQSLNRFAWYFFPSFPSPHSAFLHSILLDSLHLFAFVSVHSNFSSAWSVSSLRIRFIHSRWVGSVCSCAVLAIYLTAEQQNDHYASPVYESIPHSPLVSRVATVGSGCSRVVLFPLPFPFPSTIPPPSASSSYVSFPQRLFASSTIFRRLK